MSLSSLASALPSTSLLAWADQNRTDPIALASTPSLLHDARAGASQILNILAAVYAFKAKGAMEAGGGGGAKDSNVHM